MDLNTYKVGLEMLNKVKGGDYTPFRLVVPTSEMLRLYGRMVFLGIVPKIEDLELDVKNELWQWAKDIGFGDNVILAKNICRCLSVLHIDFENLK